MKQLLLLALALCAAPSFLQAQVLLQENFEAAGLPAGWSSQTAASDGGWQFGTAAELSSEYFTINSNGSSGIAATNDDDCNCDKSEDYLITPPLDFSALTKVVLKADFFFGGLSYQNFTEYGSIEVSLDKVNWTYVAGINGHTGWEKQVVDLSAYAGQAGVYVGIRYDDNGGFLYGLAVDNVQVEVPASLDAAMTKLNLQPFGEESVGYHISGVIFNNGITPITDLEITYAIDGGAPVSDVLSGLNIAPFEVHEFSHATAWVPASSGTHDIVVNITGVNASPDQDASNNSLAGQTEIFPYVVAPNIIDHFFLADPIFTTIATAADALDKPNDLDFFPILAKNELWVVNERDENSGGSTLTLYNAGKDDQTMLNRVDGNAWHFMSLVTGIAFSRDNFNFATSPGVKDANHSGGTFTGPTLWTSDPTIYALPSGGNGSHIDMLHGSPFSMGIAHEADNAFWVFDGWNETIVRYDFRKDHGPGNDDHADGLVRRFMEIQVKRDGDVPSHLVLDKASGWLYIVDNGNDRVLRLDIHSGTVVSALPLINEPLAEHSEMGDATWEVIIQQGLNQPSGIEIIGNRLLVSDYATGEIIVYDMENAFDEIGRIATGEPGITGIKVGPEGDIWYTNRLQNTLTKLTPAEVSGTENQLWAARIQLQPNPTQGLLQVRLPEQSDITLELSDAAGKKLKAIQGNFMNTELDLSDLPNGIYLLSIANESASTTRKVVVQH